MELVLSFSVFSEMLQGKGPNFLNIFINNLYAKFIFSVIFSWSENRSYQSLLKFLNYYSMVFINLKLVG